MTLQSAPPMALVQVSPLPPPETVVAETFLLNFSNLSSIGYPICCPGTQPRFQFTAYNAVKESPNVAKAKVEPERLEQALRDIDEVYHKTGMPMIPCILHHFCFPCR